MNARTMTGLVVAAALAGTLGCGIGDAQKRLRTAVDAKKPQLDDCYASALERDRELETDVRLWLHVSKKTGAVDRVEIAEAGLQDSTLQECVESALVGVRLDDPPRADLKVKYTFRFVRQL